MRRFLAALAALMLLFSGCCERRGSHTETRYEYFDTFVTVTAADMTDAEFRAAADAVWDELSRLHRLFDRYHDYAGVNNLKTVNDMAGISPVAAASELIDLVKFSAELYEKTDGLLNVMLGSVLSLWHDVRERALADPAAAELPDDEALREAAAHTDIALVKIDREAGTLYITDGDASLDLGAVAKGYAAEAVAKRLLELGFDNVLLNLGGNICAVGDKAGQPWMLGIQSPAGDGYAARVPLSSGSLVTSGTYQRYFTVDGRDYHHIIDPRTNYPAEGFSSVTVMATDSTLADALSTALFSMTEAEGRALAARLGVSVWWIYPDGTLVSTEN